MTLARLFRGIAVSLTVTVVAVAALVAYDLHLHRKFDAIAALNYRGYRGRVLGRKTPGEVRVGLFGGSVAMGYGVPNDRSVAGFMERALNRSEWIGRADTFTVANLASNGETGLAYFKANYELFRYLDLDTLVFYVWTDDAKRASQTGSAVQEWAFSQRSADPVLRTFGYYFVLPTVARERYYLMRYGSVEKGYREDTLLNGIDRLSSAAVHHEPTATQSLTGFIKDVAGAHKTVILALSPGGSPDLPNLWSDFKQNYGRAFAGDPNIVIADLSGIFPAAEWSSYFVDGVHYSDKGNRAVAEQLARRYFER